MYVFPQKRRIRHSESNHPHRNIHKSNSKRKWRLGAIPVGPRGSSRGAVEDATSPAGRGAFLLLSLPQRITDSRAPPRTDVRLTRNRHPVHMVWAVTPVVGGARELKFESGKSGEVIDAAASSPEWLRQRKGIILLTSRRALKFSPLINGRYSSKTRQWQIWNILSLILGRSTHLWSV